MNLAPSPARCGRCWAFQPTASPALVDARLHPADVITHDKEDIQLVFSCAMVFFFFSLFFNNFTYCSCPHTHRFAFASRIRAEKFLPFVSFTTFTSIAKLCELAAMQTMPAAICPKLLFILFPLFFNERDNNITFDLKIAAHPGQRQLVVHPGHKPEANMQIAPVK